ncbi:MAG: hypothetical protein P4M15_09725 [Alphaproteobacteria bacterium]|nr:hypothetical protein [Alphaproteobacteria bacterium]
MAASAAVDELARHIIKMDAENAYESKKAELVDAKVTPGGDARGGASNIFLSAR